MAFNLIKVPLKARSFQVFTESNKKLPTSYEVKEGDMSLSHPLIVGTNATAYARIMIKETGCFLKMFDVVNLGNGEQFVLSCILKFKSDKEATSVVLNYPIQAYFEGGPTEMQVRVVSEIKSELASVIFDFRVNTIVL